MKNFSLKRLFILNIIICFCSIMLVSFTAYAEPKESEDVEQNYDYNLDIIDLNTFPGSNPNVSVKGIVDAPFYNSFQDICVYFSGSSCSYTLRLGSPDDYSASVEMLPGEYKVQITHAGDKNKYHAFTFNDSFCVSENNVCSFDFIMGTDDFINKNKKNLYGYQAQEDAYEDANKVHMKDTGEPLIAKKEPAKSHKNEKKDNSRIINSFCLFFIIFIIIFLIYKTKRK